MPKNGETRRRELEAAVLARIEYERRWDGSDDDKGMGDAEERERLAIAACRRAAKTKETKMPKTKKKIARPQRVVYTITWRKLDRGWNVTSPGGATFLFSTQREAVRLSCLNARVYRRDTGGLAQVVLRGKDGRIKWERTYGADPARSPG